MKNILVIVFGFLLAEAALQIACQVSPTVNAIIFVFSDDNSEALEPEPIKLFGGELGRVGNPSHPEHDRRGFRNSGEIDRADIVAIGDSNTYGTSVAPHEAWPVLLGKHPDHVSYNMGLGGYGPAQYLLLLDQALALAPRYIVVAIYFGNDFYDNYKLALTNPEIAAFLSDDELDTIRQLEKTSPPTDLTWLFRAAGPDTDEWPEAEPAPTPTPEKPEQKVARTAGNKVETKAETRAENKVAKQADKPKAKAKPQPPTASTASPLNTQAKAPASDDIDDEPAPGSFRVFLSKHCALYGLARAIKDAVFAVVSPEPSVLSHNFGAAKKALTPEKLAYFSVFDGGDGWQTILTSEYRITALDMQNPRIAIGFRMTPRLLAAMKEKLRGTGTELLVALLPTKEIVFRERVHDTDAHAGYAELIEYERGMREELMTFMESSEIDYIDLLPYLQRSPEQPYFKNADGHLNPVGHEVVSEAILSSLQ